MSTLSFTLFGSNQLEAADFSLSCIRKIYPNSYIAILSDNGENYSVLSKKYNCEYFYFNYKMGSPVEPFGWRKNNVKEFLQRMYISCIRCNSTHMMYLEEDVVIFKEITIPENSQIIGFKTRHPEDGKFLNGFPDEFLKIIQLFSGKPSCVDGYGAQGGCVFNVRTFIENYNFIINFIDKNLDYIQDNIYPTAGWIDCFLTWYFMLCGKDYILNKNFIEAHGDKFLKTNDTSLTVGYFDVHNPPEFAELATYYKGKYK